MFVFFQIFFTMLEKSPEPIIRANLIVGAGDLSFRFPNTLEPWTPRMYACLRDESSHVRSNTLTVLTHLILNDMIKVFFVILVVLNKYIFQSQMNILAANTIMCCLTQVNECHVKQYHFIKDLISELLNFSSWIDVNNIKMFLLL
jgi:hypothetical protein